jgi:hypothetical protein
MKEKLNKDIEILKKNQIKMLEMKGSVSKMKMSCKSSI